MLAQLIFFIKVFVNPSLADRTLSSFSRNLNEFRVYFLKILYQTIHKLTFSLCDHFFIDLIFFTGKEISLILLFSQVVFYLLFFQRKVKFFLIFFTFRGKVFFQIDLLQIKQFLLITLIFFIESIFLEDIFLIQSFFMHTRFKGRNLMFCTLSVYKLLFHEH